jgi:hypothetical protein
MERIDSSRSSNRVEGRTDAEVDETKAMVERVWQRQRRMGIAMPGSPLPKGLRAAMKAAAKHKYTPPPPLTWERGQKLTGRHFNAMRPWLQLTHVADLIGISTEEIRPFVEGWLRDPVVGPKSRVEVRRGHTVELFARENALKLRDYVQAKPQEFFTRDEAAKALGTTRAEVKRRIQLGLLDVMHVNGRNLIALPVGGPGYYVPGSARRMESPCASLCRPATFSAAEATAREVWRGFDGPWGPRPERKTARRASTSAKAELLALSLRSIKAKGSPVFLVRRATQAGGAR